jgi:L-cysteine S-thiosulfotransferase
MTRHAATAAALATLALMLSAGTAPLAFGQAASQPLVKFEVKNGGIPASLTGHPGDPQKGRAVVVNRVQGNCLACHAISALSSEPYHGNVGPSLDGVARRLSPAEMRLRIVDATKLNADTMMPPFYRVDGLNKVMHQFQGKPVLTAEQVEDVVAFLETLK